MKTFEYALKTWQTSVLLSPVFISIYLCITQYEPEPLSFILLAIVISIIYSFPSFLIFAFACRWVAGRNRTMVQKKSLLSIIGISLTTLAFYLFYNGIFMHGIMPGLILYVTIYSSAIVIGIWFYKLDAINYAAVEEIGAAY
jgi:hypothetical protein